MKIRWFFALAGAALLVVLPFIAGLLIPGGTFLLHNSRSLLSIVLGIGIDVAAAMLFGLLVLLLVPRIEPPTRTVIVGILSGVTLWWLLFCILTGLLLLPPRGVLVHADPIMRRSEAVLLGLGFTFPMLAAVFALLRPNAAFALARALRIGLAAISVSWVWILPHLIYLAALKPIPSFDYSANTTPTNGSSRIVWILMDELPQDLIFDHPVPGAAYPNLNQFRSTSVSFGNITVAGEKTEQIIPALLSGHPFGGIKSRSDGDLVVLNPEAHKWLPFNPNETLFGMARDHGWNPGVAGWFNPYCRIFQSVLTACSWRPGIQDQMPLQRIGASQTKSAFENALVIPRFFFELFFWKNRTSGADTALLEQNLRDYQVVMQNAHQLIQNERIHFVYLHLPVPHPPGLYNRATHQLCACGNFIDNLTLADDTLAVLLHEIQQSSAADHTTIVLSSDHSWRVSLWKDGIFWTPEEGKVGAHFTDQRPVFLVHFPGQTAQFDIPAATPEMTEHDIIAAMLQNKMNTPQDLLAFVHAQQPRTAQAVSAPH